MELIREVEIPNGNSTDFDGSRSSADGGFILSDSRWTSSLVLFQRFQNL